MSCRREVNGCVRCRIARASAGAAHLPRGLGWRALKVGREANTLLLDLGHLLFTRFTRLNRYNQSKTNRLAVYAARCGASRDNVARQGTISLLTVAQNVAALLQIGQLGFSGGRHRAWCAQLYQRCHTG
jgi:hypothetical protein